MKESPANRAFLAFLPVRDKALAFGAGSHYFVSLINGSERLQVIGRDKDATCESKPRVAAAVGRAFARRSDNNGHGWRWIPLASEVTWRSLGTLCRERDWSPSRLLYELQHGLRYRTFPPGHTIDWSAPLFDRRDALDDLVKGVVEVPIERRGVSAIGTQIIGIEIGDDAPADAPAANASARWAADTIRRMRTEGKIPERVIKAELARLLENEARKAVKTGQLSHALKASYMENELARWGIWPLDRFE
jgi:hypothetical protein